MITELWARVDSHGLAWARVDSRISAAAWRDLRGFAPVPPRRAHVRLAGFIAPPR